MTPAEPTEPDSRPIGDGQHGDATANLLGAVALVVTDRTIAQVDAACGQSGAAAPALSALQHILDRPSLDQLGSVLALTPSGTVRLVDRLAAAGLLSRGPGQDGRTRAVSLTNQGAAVARDVTAARAGYLQRLLGGLTDTERQLLHALLGKIAAAVAEEKDDGPWMCRLCDLIACGRSEGRCPAANAAAATYAGTGPRS